ncbi:MAG: hypothetical protein ACLS49_02290 [Christensenellales bacterium]
MVLKLKKIRKMTVLLLVMCLLASGCSKAEEENTNDIDSVKLKSNQEIVTCKITAIYGNEIEYTIAKEQSVSDAKKDKMPSSSGAPDMKGGDMPSSSGAPDMKGGDMPSSSGAPDMNNGNNDNSAGGPPDMGGDSKNSSLDSSGENKSDKSKSSKNSDKKVYTLTDETDSTTIPVGTDVITSLGKTTTFSRLSNGDIIKMIMEKDSSGEKVVVGVWIVS